MSAIDQTVALAAFELRGAVRSRWVTVGAVVFAVSAFAATLAGLRSFSSLGLAGAGAATDGLVQVALLLPPLIGLLLGAGSLARDRERGLLGMVASQPLHRAQLPLAAFAGCLVAVWVVVALGVGVGMLVVSMASTVADLLGIVVVLGVGLAAAAAAVALGVALSAVSSTLHQATAAAAALWLLLALGLDLLLAGVAPGLRLGPAGLLAAVIANPLEAARVLVLLLLEGPGALGPFGAYLIDRFGRIGAVTLLAGIIAGWTLAPLALAAAATSRRDV
jgi:ABC-type transport system involved in multi-copper enzyme maturation permease subunit